MPSSRNSANGRALENPPRSSNILLNATRFLAVMATALALGAALAHLYELPNKIGLSADDYLTVQQNYRGWHFLGVAVIASLVLSAVLAWLEWKHPARGVLALFAALCIAVNLIVFFSFTFPANKATENWTTLPENWESLRQQWEYAHAVGAGLYLLALASLTLALIVDRR